MTSYTLNFQPTLATLLSVSFFSGIYILYLLLKLRNSLIDLYDFFMLSTVALIPFSFVLFPSLSVQIARLLGVRYPFLVLFGALFFILFLLVNRLIVSLHTMEKDLRHVIQETALKDHNEA